MQKKQPIRLESANEISDRWPAERHTERLRVDLYGEMGVIQKMDSRVKYNIISTGSDGNATILEDFVLIDCGVPYKTLEPYVSKLKLVLLTHIHS